MLTNKLLDKLNKIFIINNNHLKNSIIKTIFKKSKEKDKKLLINLQEKQWKDNKENLLQDNNIMNMKKEDNNFIHKEKKKLMKNI